MIQILVLFFLFITANAGPISVNRSMVNSQSLQDLINSDHLYQRSNDLQRIADMSLEKSGVSTRVIGSIGHQKTMEYIKSALQNLNDYYDISEQPVTIPQGNVFSVNLSVDFRNISSKALQLTPPTPSNEQIIARLRYISNSGCEDGDYSELTKGEIALTERGKCTFGAQSAMAGKHGASALLIFNHEGRDYIPDESLYVHDDYHVPTLVIGREDGLEFVEKLKRNYPLRVQMTVNSSLNLVKTANLIVETKTGDHNNVVVLGAHSDSVDEGPGINDNGSGAIALIEVARALAQFDVKNAVRFIWFTGEEQGLMGSSYYVSRLGADGISKIRMFFNFDMIASPNYEYQVYDVEKYNNELGSVYLQRFLIDYYKSRGVQSKLVDIDGRSDYQAFLQLDIPSGMVTTGAEQLKSAESQAIVGGQADKPFDACYHLACDTVNNLNYDAFFLNTQLIAHVVGTYGASMDSFPVLAD